MARGRAVFVVGALACVGAALGPGCLAPTEITFTLTTDVPCGSVSGSSIAVGAVTSTSRTCDAGELGTLVVVPGASSDAEVVFRAALALHGAQPESCAGGDPRCVVATRAIRFVKHTPLRVTVALQAACVGVACGPGLTCFDAACVPDDIDPTTCADGGCNAVPPDAAPDVAPASVDAAPDSPLGAPDAPSDAPISFDDASDATVDTGIVNVDAAPDSQVRGAGCSHNIQCAVPYTCCCTFDSVTASCNSSSFCAGMGGACVP